MIDVAGLVGTAFSGLSALVIEDVEDGGDVIVVRARTWEGAVACPGCGTVTARVHGYHDRTAGDVPVDGRRVQVRVRARRLRCAAPGCPRQTFREQVPGGLERCQRRTVRLTVQVSAVARELAGRASARLLPALGISASRHTMLRGLLKIPLPALAVPRVLGIDDFALRRSSERYGVAVDPAAGTVYVVNCAGGTVSVIDVATRAVTATIPVGSEPFGVAVGPATHTAYVTNGSNDVSVIDEATSAMTVNIPMSYHPLGWRWTRPPGPST